MNDKNDLTNDQIYMSYFYMGERYLTTAEILIQSIVENNNNKFAISNSLEDCEKKCEQNYIKSTSIIYIPALFCLYQAAELYIKGLILVKCPDYININHESCCLLETLKEKYTEQNEIYELFKKYYKNQVAMVKEYKKGNEISDTKTMYNSLRYPQTIDGEKFYNYDSLILNNSEIIDQLKNQLTIINEIQCKTVKTVREMEKD